MNEGAVSRSFIIDCNALYEIASTKSGNVKAVYIDMLSNGTLIVPTIVWKEFSEIYDEEASQLKGSIKAKISMKEVYYKGAASLAHKLNSGFTLSPYDPKTDLYAAAICSIEGYTLVTTAFQKKVYKGVSEFDVIDLQSLIADQGII